MPPPQPAEEPEPTASEGGSEFAPDEDFLEADASTEIADEEDPTEEFATDDEAPEAVSPRAYMRPLRAHNRRCVQNAVRLCREACDQSIEPLSRRLSPPALSCPLAGPAHAPSSRSLSR